MGEAGGIKYCSFDIYFLELRSVVLIRRVFGIFIKILFI